MAAAPAPCASRNATSHFGRSGRMAGALERIARGASGAGNGEELRQMCLEAAALMGVENHEWWVLLSFQDVRLHV